MEKLRTQYNYCQYKVEFIGIALYRINILFFTFIVVPIEANKLYFQNTITINKPYIPLIIWNFTEALLYFQTFKFLLNFFLANSLSLVSLVLGMN